MPKPFNRSAPILVLPQVAIPVNKEVLAEGDVIYLADRSKHYVLGKKIGSGGEGAVFEVRGIHEVCKLYSKRSLTESARAKIELLTTRMVDYPGICWPSQAVFDADRRFRGFLMPPAGGVPLRQSLFLPAPFMRKNPKWTRLNSTRLAIKIVEQIRHLHSLGVTLGDINPLNFLLADNEDVFLVDCDSFQVEGFPCPVGTVNFTPPELQGKNFRRVLRTTENELFAVATLLFMIFFPGNCPYTHTGGADGGANINSGQFVYTSDWVRGGATAPMGVWRYCWAHLSPKLKFLFTLAFCSSKRGERRPSTSEWLEALLKYEQILTEPKNVFQGPKPVAWGYDLSIMPQSPYYHPEYGNNNELPRDGRTGYERLKEYAVQELVRTMPPTPPVTKPSQPTYHPPVAKTPVKTPPTTHSAPAPAQNNIIGDGCFVLVVVVIVFAILCWLFA